MVATKPEGLTKSKEDYLEAILLLVREGQVARVRDIAKRIDVGMPAVSVALRSLSRMELVNYDPYEFITLTDRGREIAEQVSQRHHILRTFLVDVLGLDADSAEANACRMEHAADAALLQRLAQFTDFLRRRRTAGDDVAEAFRREVGVPEGERQ